MSPHGWSKSHLCRDLHDQRSHCCAQKRQVSASVKSLLGHMGTAPGVGGGGGTHQGDSQGRVLSLDGQLDVAGPSAHQHGFLCK